MEKPKITNASAQEMVSKREIISFDEYSELLSYYSGMNMQGVGDETIFNRLVNNPDTVYKEMIVKEQNVSVPYAASNEALEFFDPDDIPPKSLITILPDKLYAQEDLDELSQEHTVLMARQCNLSDELTQRYISKIKSVPSKDLEDFISQNGAIELMPKSGFAEFIGVSRYDISGCDDLRNNPLPTEIITDNTVSTTSVEYIKEKLPELTKLHKDIFEQQTSEIGYYDGLDEVEIVRVIESGEFTPVATFDKDTGEAIAFALFAKKLLNAEDLGWLNVKKTNEVLETMSETDDYILAMPYVIVSKGKGIFPLISKIAAYATVYGTNAKELFTLTKTSSASVNYTPAIINKTLESLGFKHQNSKIEATFLTKI